jgi:DNA polymerase III delta prime subunit
MGKSGGWVGHVLVVRGTPARIADIRAELERAGIKTTANPDVYVRTYKQFGIDEARELRQMASMRPVQGARRFFVIACNRMLAEAQNALLKTLEEPPADALFFFILPSPESLLPTVRSRAHIYEPPTGIEDESDAVRFLASAPAKRLELLKPFLERDDEGERDLGSVIAFLSSLERALPRGKGAEPIYRARKYITDKGALVKPLLEQVALLVPVVVK